MLSPFNKQKREFSSQRHSPKSQQVSKRLRLQVGEAWPEGTTTKIESIPAHEPLLKAGVISGIVAFCGVLIATLTVHAMVIGNQERLDTILKVAWKVLIAFGLWAIAAHRWDKMKTVLRKGAQILKE